jgi:hypothetical protein
MSVFANRAKFAICIGTAPRCKDTKGEKGEERAKRQQPQLVMCSWKREVGVTITVSASRFPFPVRSNLETRHSDRKPHLCFSRSRLASGSKKKETSYVDQGNRTPATEHGLGRGLNSHRHRHSHSQANRQTDKKGSENHAECWPSHYMSYSRRPLPSPSRGFVPDLSMQAIHQHGRCCNYRSPTISDNAKQGFWGLEPEHQAIYLT